MPAAIALVGELVEAAEAELGERGTVGVGIPGSLSPASGLVRGANSTWLNGGRLDRGPRRAARPPGPASPTTPTAWRMSEAADGAGAGFRTVFAAILGTGAGAGSSRGGRILEGRNRIAGRMGPQPAALDGRRRSTPARPAGAASGAASRPSSAAPRWRPMRTGRARAMPSRLPARAAAGDARAAAALGRHTDRLARALAHVVNLLDPDCIVLGGGLSNMAHLYEEVPRRCRASSSATR